MRKTISIRRERPHDRGVELRRGDKECEYSDGHTSGDDDDDEEEDYDAVGARDADDWRAANGREEVVRDERGFPQRSTRRRTMAGTAVADPDPDADAVFGAFGTETQLRRWRRPPVRWEQQYATEGKCTFQVNDVDTYSIGATVYLRLHGVTSHGHSVCCTVGGFLPYFYVACPPDFDARAQGPALRQVLNSMLDEAGVRSAGVVSVEGVERTSVMGHQFGRRRPLLRITTQRPNSTWRLRSWFETGSVPLPHGVHSLQTRAWSTGRALLTYESNVRLPVRFLVDTGMAGCSWAEVPLAAASVLHPAPLGVVARGRARPRTRAQVELHVDDYRHICVHRPEGEWARINPLRVLSYDIECASPDGRFPDPGVAPVIQIACYVYDYGGGGGGSSRSGEGGGGSDSGSADRDGQAAAPVDGHPDVAGLVEHNVFILGTCAALPPGIQAHTFDDEATMLLAWRDFVVESDPDVITGYNITGFDTPYLLRRAAKLGIGRDFSELGRVLGQRAELESSTFESKARGRRESERCEISGRTQLDMQEAIRMEHKLSSYSLNAVSAHFLRDQKVDVHHSQITPLHQRNARTRRLLAIYCAKDAKLPVLLMDKLMTIPNYVQIARVTGVPLSYVLDKGQQIKVYSQMLRAARERGMVVPTPPHDRESQLYADLYRTLRVDPPPPPPPPHDDCDSGAPATPEAAEAMAVRRERLLAAARRHGRLIAKGEAAAADCDSGGAPAGPRAPAWRPIPADVARVRRRERRAAEAAAARERKERAAKRAAAARDIEFAGATVFDPDIGFWNFPVSTLDFASLYPSIMMAHNLCHTTLLCTQADVDECVARYGPDSYEVTPEGYCFVRAKHARGLLPSILENLLAARRAAKRSMGAVAERIAVDKLHLEWLRAAARHLAATGRMPTRGELVAQTRQDLAALDADIARSAGNPQVLGDLRRTRARIEAGAERRADIAAMEGAAQIEAAERRLQEARRADELELAVWDGLQLALKISANSVYGFTGALKAGTIPRLEVSSSVTGIGRAMIDRVKLHVESTYTVANGYPSDAIVIYGDTDSVFCLLVPAGLADAADGAAPPVQQEPAELVAAAMKFGTQAAESATRLFVRPVGLEFEKVYMPMLLINKKRYVGVRFTDSATRHDKVESKGIELVRRDGCRLTRDVMRHAIERLMVQRDLAGALEYARRRVADLVADRVDLTELVISKALSKDPLEYPGRLPHVELAMRLRLREPATAPQCGDRVPYVITGVAQDVKCAPPPPPPPPESEGEPSRQVRGEPLSVEIVSARDSKAYQRSEDPLYALQHNLPIDNAYYISSQLRKPLMRIFAPVLGSARAVDRAIFEGDHMRVARQRYATNGIGITRHMARVRARCLACNCSIVDPLSSAALRESDFERRHVRAPPAAKRPAERSRGGRRKRQKGRAAPARGQPLISAFFGAPRAAGNGPAGEPPAAEETPPAAAAAAAAADAADADAAADAGTGAGAGAGADADADATAESREGAGPARPGLCAACQGRWDEVLARETDARRVLAERRDDLDRQCRECQGEDLYGAVECTNRDCDIFYSHARVARDLREVEGRLAQLGISAGAPDW